MGTSSSEIWPGLALADAEVNREADAYLRSRLRICYQVGFFGASGIYVVSNVARILTGTWSLEFLLSASALVHLASCIVAGAVLALLTWHRCTAFQLRALDVLGLQFMIATILTIYALGYERGSRSNLGLGAVFLVARAVVIPSTARTTLLVSLPAAVGVLVVQVLHGTVYGSGGVELSRAVYHGDMIWNQGLILLGVAVAVVASRVNYSLRTQVLEARKFGQYRLEERIGQGAMGEVYRATHSLLRRPTAVKILRPDLADTDTSLTQVGSICGTPETLAPEVIRGEPASEASDLYGVGVVAYRMVTGLPVFEATTPLALIREHLETTPVAPDARNPAVPADLSKIILRLLAKDPADRLSARALRSALAECADAGTWTDRDAEGWWERYGGR